MAADEIAHNVIKQDGNIQIREYAPTVVAEVTIQSTRSEAPSRAFRTLFDYISGNNITAQNIPMTTPVSQEPSSSQEIPMTTPVSQEQADDGSWTIAFYMPNDMKLEDAPQPKNEKIIMRAVPAKRMAAIRFSGRGTDSNIAQHEKELRDYLNANDIAYEDKPLYAFYDAPFVPWFLRRNEVLLTLK